MGEEAKHVVGSDRSKKIPKKLKIFQERFSGFYIQQIQDAVVNTLSAHQIPTSCWRKCIIIFLETDHQSAGKYTGAVIFKGDKHLRSLFCRTKTWRVVDTGKKNTERFVGRNFYEIVNLYEANGKTVFYYYYGDQFYRNGVAVTAEHLQELKLVTPLKIEPESSELPPFSPPTSGSYSDIMHALGDSPPAPESVGAASAHASPSLAEFTQHILWQLDIKPDEARAPVDSQPPAPESVMASPLQQGTQSLEELTQNILLQLSITGESTAPSAPGVLIPAAAVSSSAETGPMNYTLELETLTKNILAQLEKTPIFSTSTDSSRSSESVSSVLSGRGEEFSYFNTGSETSYGSHDSDPSSVSSYDGSGSETSYGSGSETSYGSHDYGSSGSETSYGSDLEGPTLSYSSSGRPTHYKYQVVSRSMVYGNFAEERAKEEEKKMSGSPHYDRAKYERLTEELKKRLPLDGLKTRLIENALTQINSWCDENSVPPERLSKLRFIACVGDVGVDTHYYRVIIIGILDAQKSINWVVEFIGELNRGRNEDFLGQYFTTMNPNKFFNKAAQLEMRTGDGRVGLVREGSLWRYDLGQETQKSDLAVLRLNNLVVNTTTREVTSPERHIDFASCDEVSLNELITPKEKKEVQNRIINWFRENKVPPAQEKNFCFIELRATRRRGKQTERYGYYFWGLEFRAGFRYFDLGTSCSIIEFTAEAKSIPSLTVGMSLSTPFEQEIAGQLVITLIEGFDGGYHLLGPPPTLANFLMLRKIGLTYNERGKIIPEGFSESSPTPESGSFTEEVKKEYGRLNSEQEAATPTSASFSMTTSSRTG